EGESESGPLVAPTDASVDEEGRRRRRPRRKRGDEPRESVAATPLGDAPIQDVADFATGPEPIWLVQREPLERVTDENSEDFEGDMLKDAMLQEKITERIHAEEYRTSLVEVEPTPEVHVGSFRRDFSEGADFERVSDESGEPQDEPPKAAPRSTTATADTGDLEEAKARDQREALAEESETGNTP